MAFQELAVKHTPYVKIDPSTGKPLVFCAAGEDDRHLDLWLLSPDTCGPVQLIARGSIPNCTSICSPWIGGTPNVYDLYVTLAKNDQTLYRIAMFRSTVLSGPYTLVSDDLFPGQFITYDSPCIAGNYMFFSGVREVTKANAVFCKDFMTGLISEVALPDPQGFVRAILMKPNVFIVGPDQLAMFVLEIGVGNIYRTSVLSKDGSAPWEWICEFPYYAEDEFYYKPFLFKGNLIMVSRSSDLSVLGAYLLAKQIKLSEVWFGFTDYPTDYSLPNLGY